MACRRAAPPDRGRTGGRFAGEYPLQHAAQQAVETQDAEDHDGDNSGSVVEAGNQHRSDVDQHDHDLEGGGHQRPPAFPLQGQPGQTDQEDEIDQRRSQQRIADLDMLCQAADNIQT